MSNAEAQKEVLKYATEAEIEGAGCGSPVILEKQQTWREKLSSFLPLFRKHGTKVNNGIVLGVNPYTDDILMHDGPENVLVMGPTRCGKGINTVIPTCVLWQKSLFCFDKYNDLWDKTAAYRYYTMGQRVLKFSPLREDSARWNPLEEVRLFHGPDAASADIRVLADSIICCTDTGLSAIDSLHQQAASFLAAIITYLFAVSDYVHGIPAMSDILKFISDKDVTEVVALLQSSFPSDKCLPEISTFLDLNEMPSDDVIQIMKEALKPYSIPAVDFHTKTSSFHFSDFIESEAPLSESKTPLSVYYCLDGQWDYRGIASLFVNMLFYKLSLSSITKEHQSKCLVMLDDSTELSYLPLVESAFVTSAAHGVRICLVIQDYLQLERLFATHDMITQSCGVQIYFTPNIDCGITSAKKISNLLGGNKMTSEEILRLGRDKVIVFIRENTPILARKFRYYNHSWLKKVCE